MRSSNIPTLKSVKCPACNKPRMYKYLNEDGTAPQADQKTIDVRGETRYVDVCKFCATKYQKRDEKYIKENMKRVAKAIQDGDNQEEFYLDEI